MILVSGATGFLGTHLLKKLCSENTGQIRAMYRSETKKMHTITLLKTLLDTNLHLKISEIEWVKADILDIPSLDNIFVGIHNVYHCAAWVGNSGHKDSLMRKINIEGVANMVNIALKHNVRKFCHVSSIAALGQYPNSNKIDEQAPREGQHERSIYSITKYGAELEVWRASQEGLDIVIVNPGVILGSGFFNAGSGLMFSKILQNTLFYPAKQTGFVFVDDVTAIMTKLMHSDIRNQRYILVGENTSFKVLMDKIAEIFGKKKPKLKANKALLYLVWLFQLIQSLFVPLKTRVSLSLIKQLNLKKIYLNDKSIQDLGVDYTPMDESIKLIFEDYKLIRNN